MEQAGLGDAGYTKFMQILLTEQGILYTIIRGRGKTGVLQPYILHGPVYAPPEEKKTERCRSEELK